MKIAIMQPYLFPYIGYWQLINAVDKFVILDDVNYIKRGYINRNSILLNAQQYKFTIPIYKASQNRLICETKLNFGQEEKKKFLLTIKNAYRRAPYFLQVMPVIEKIINYDEDDLTKYIQNSLLLISEYLGIDTEFMLSSKIDKDNSLKAQDRILEICKYLETDIYINPCGGRSLYSKEDFMNRGLQLYFLDTRMDRIVYKQGGNDFVERLSIIDVMMYSSVQDIQRFLEEYDLNE